MHRAVESAAFANSERRAQRMEMVRFLVDELKVDVNTMDVPEGKKYPNHWGTPMAYALIAKDGGGDVGEEIVRFLLDVNLFRPKWRGLDMVYMIDRASTFALTEDPC